MPGLRVSPATCQRASSWAGVVAESHRAELIDLSATTLSAAGRRSRR